MVSYSYKYISLVTDSLASCECKEGACAAVYCFITNGATAEDLDEEDDYYTSTYTYAGTGRTNDSDPKSYLYLIGGIIGLTIVIFFNAYLPTVATIVMIAMVVPECKKIREENPNFEPNIGKAVAYFFIGVVATFIAKYAWLLLLVVLNFYRQTSGLNHWVKSSGAEICIINNCIFIPIIASIWGALDQKNKK